MAAPPSLALVSGPSRNSENSCIEEISLDKNIVDTFYKQIETKKNVEKFDHLESEENCPPIEPPSPNSKSTRQISMSKNILLPFCLPN